MAFQIIKINRECKDKYSVLIDMMKMHCLLTNEGLSISEMSLMSYYIVHGITRETDELYFYTEKVTSQQQVSNIKYSLKLKGLIIKLEGNNWQLNNKYVFNTVNLDRTPVIELILNTKAESNGESK